MLAALSGNYGTPEWFSSIDKPLFPLSEVGVLREERDAARAEVARLRAVVASVEALRPVRHVCSDGVWLRYQDVIAALTAAQDAPAPTPTEADR